MIQPHVTVWRLAEHFVLVEFHLTAFLCFHGNASHIFTLSRTLCLNNGFMGVSHQP